MCKVASTNKESKIGIGGNKPTAEEINKCWRFVFDTYTKHRDAFETRLSSITTPPSPWNERIVSTSPRLSSISATLSSSSSSCGQRRSIAIPTTPSSTNRYYNHINNSNSLARPYQVETFEEFMRQYVMHISDVTNVVSRIAVKSHSPLLPVKHSYHSNEYQICAQSFDITLNHIVERI